MPKILKLEPAAVGSVAAALYAIVAAFYQVFVAHGSVLQPDVLVALLTTLWGAWTRAKVTPLADPKDDKGRALRPSQQ